MIAIPVSIGELVDKITILQLKEEFIKDEDKLKNVRHELKQLQGILDRLNLDCEHEINELRDVNRVMWYNEDRARKFPQSSWTIGEADKIATIAMETYHANNRRAQIKYAINQKYNSDIVEVKSYT